MGIIPYLSYESRINRDATRACKVHGGGEGEWKIEQ